MNKDSHGAAAREPALSSPQTKLISKSIFDSLLETPNMKTRMIILTALFGLAGMIQAQTPSPSPSTPPADAPRAVGLSTARDTIDHADAQFNERQSEVLDDPMAQSRAGSEGAVLLDEPVARLVDEAAPALPDTVESSDEAVGDVYLEETEDVAEAEMEMADDTISVNSSGTGKSG